MSASEKVWWSEQKGKCVLAGVASVQTGLPITGHYSLSQTACQLRRHNRPTVMIKQMTGNPKSPRRERAADAAYTHTIAISRARLVLTRHTVTVITFCRTFWLPNRHLRIGEKIQTLMTPLCKEWSTSNLRRNQDKCSLNFISSAQLTSDI